MARTNIPLDAPGQMSSLGCIPIYKDTQGDQLPGLDGKTARACF